MNESYLTQCLFGTAYFSFKKKGIVLYIKKANFEMILAEPNMTRKPNETELRIQNKTEAKSKN